MKIAVLTNDYPPHATGGAGVIAETQVQELQRRGQEVKVFYYPITFTNKSVFTRLVSHLFDLRAKTGIVDEIIAWQPEILLTHNLTGCGIGTPRAVKRQGIPWVHLLHDVQLIEPSGRIVSGERFGVFRAVWRFAWSSLRRAALGSPNEVISPTRWLLEYHRSRGFFWSSKTDVIPNPLAKIDMETVTWDGREPSILFVGRVDVDKGISILVRAWRSLGEARPRLEVVGDGAWRARLEAMKDERLVIRGPVPHDRIVSLMSRSRVVAVPSLVMENQPTVALEGLAAGCNVVASDVGGVAETIGDAGHVVRAGSAEELATAIREGVSNPPDLSRVARVLEMHQLDVVVDALEGVLASNL
jgi:glycosyltransferase involved in cell wall biosynthesis